MPSLSVHCPKMLHYLMGQTIRVISKVNLLCLLMIKPSAQNEWLPKWAILLSQYEMRFLLYKANNGQALADFLAKSSTSKQATIYEGFHMRLLRCLSLKQYSMIKSCNFILTAPLELVRKGIQPRNVGCFYLPLGVCDATSVLTLKTVQH